MATLKQLKKLSEKNKTMRAEADPKKAEKLRQDFEDYRAKLQKRK